MFDLEDDDLTGAVRERSPLPSSPGKDKQLEDDKLGPLDTPSAQQLFYRLLDNYVRELDRQEFSRSERASDDDFYDNIQWSEEDTQTLKDRGQVPLVYNVISTTVDWVIGTEKRGRSDFKILPRRKEQGAAAEKKTHLLKYLSDCNRTPFHRSRAFADAVKTGLGWLEDGMDADEDGEPLYTRFESWRNMLWDSAATEMDLTDARYIYRSKWVDLDTAQAIFPERAAFLERAARDGGELFTTTGDYGDDPMDFAEHEMERSGSVSRMPNRYNRRRVRIVEAWFKKPVAGKRLKGGEFNGEIFDEHSAGHQQTVQSGEAEVIDKTIMRVYVALFTTGEDGALLALQESPYRHNRYPFTPVWGNRRGRDGLPYGLINGLRGIQEDINKRASKALHILSANKVVVEEGAVDDMDELAEEVSHSDAFIVIKPGKKIELNADRDLADAHLEFMARDIALIQNVGGVTDENLGRKTNATSGIAIERRQDQGSTATTHYFDHLRLAMQIQGEKQLVNVEQFMTDEKQFRITNMEGQPDFVEVNDGLPDNDITRTKADFVISEADWRASVRQAAADQLLETIMKLAPAAPEVAMVVLDLAVENMDLPNREEIVRRIRTVTGQRDPNAEEPTEEDVARAKQQEEQAARQKAIEDAQMRKLVAEAVEKEMKALHISAQTARTNIDSMGGPQRGAIDIAADTVTAPALAPVADEILREAGVIPRSEKENAMAEEQQAAADEQAQAQAEQMQAQQEQQQQEPGLQEQADQPPTDDGEL